MAKLVFLVEERSMAGLLETLLPRLLPNGVAHVIVPHNGKSDLQKSVPRKIRGWREPGVRFIVVQDQDSNDCLVLKRKLVDICTQAGRPDTLVRIACQEMEAWFIGDLRAVAEAFGQPSLADLQTRAKYRSPDSLPKPSEELKNMIKGYQKTAGARAIGRHLDYTQSLSPSFRHFVEGVSNIL